jgi:hypothetical protein
LSRGLSCQETAPGLERRLALAEAAVPLQAFEDALFSELRRKEDQPGLDGGAASAAGHEALRSKIDDLPLVSPGRQQQEQLRAALRPLAVRLAARGRRRRRRGYQQLDVRRTLARSVETGGVPLRLHFRDHRRRRPQLVVLADVSGSMADYSRFTLSLLETLRHELSNLRCFAFVDGAAELTGKTLRQPFLLAPSLLFIPGVVRGDGHSDYQAALEAFADAVSSSLTSPRSTNGWRTSFSTPERGGRRAQNS